MVTDIARMSAPIRIDKIAPQLKSWLINELADSSLIWLEQTIQRLTENPSEQVLFSCFSVAPRRVGKADLLLTAEDLQAADELRVGWMPSHWSVDQAVRTLLLLSFPSTDSDRYVSALDKLFSAADVAEQIALYQALPLFPHADKFLGRAIDGLRTNITTVFDAIALNNPYPAEYFSEAAWNQMVLKALFVGSRLSRIQGLDDRANSTLARMLSDYAHERWAAGRVVNPQLWRPLGACAQGDLVVDLKRVLSSSELFEQQAAALACASAPTPEGRALLNMVPALKQSIEDGQLTWQDFSETHQ